MAKPMTAADAKKSPKVHSGLGGTGGPLCSMVPDAALKTARTTLDSAHVTCGNCRKQLGLPKLSQEAGRVQMTRAVPP